MTAVLWCGLFTLTTFAQPNEDQPELRIGYFGTGVGQISPNHWGLATVTLTNPTADTQNLMPLTYLEAEPSIQFGRSLWVPPKAQRRSWQLLRLGDVPDTERSVPSISLLVHDQQGKEQMLSRRPLPLMVGHGPLATGIVMDPHEERANQFVIDASIVFRGEEDTTLAPRLSNVPPSNALGYDSVGRMVIAMQHPPFDELQLDALRQWINGGGTLWIMLDRVDPNWPKQLLGKHWTFAEVDRTRLTTVESPGHDNQNRSRIEFEEPVTLVRVLSQDALSNLASVYPHRGWPTLLSLSFGRGQVMVTTLGERGWMSGDEPTPRLEALADLLHQDLKTASILMGPKPRETEVLLAEREVKAIQLTRALIGYSIINRTWIAIVLVGYCVAFIVMMIVLSKRDQLEWLGAGGLVLAVFFAGVMISVGMLGRSSIEATTATAAWFEVEPSTNMASVFGVTDIYSPLFGTGDPQRITGNQPASVYWPSLKPEVGATRRLVWSDVNRWAWRGVDLPKDATIRGTFQAMQTIDDVMTPGLIPGRVGFQLDSTSWIDSIGLRDAIIVGPTGVSRVDATDGMWIGGRTVNTNRDMLASSLPEVEAEPVTAMMREAIVTLREREQGLHLIGWSREIPTDVEVSGRDSRQLDRSVVSMPVTIRRPADGAEVQLPSWMLDYEIIRRRDDGRRSFITAFDPSQRQWLELTQSGQVAMDFLLPQAVGDVRVTAVTCEIDIDAPGREVQVMLPVGPGRAEQTVATFNSPTTPQSITLDDLSITTRDRRLPITIKISSDTDPLAMRTWKLHDLNMTLTATLLNRPNPDGAQP